MLFSRDKAESGISSRPEVLIRIAACTRKHLDARNAARRSGTNNSAMFAEIVPEQLRSAVYAFDRSFEGAVGATAAPLVGLVAEKVFGYHGSLGQEVAPDPAVTLANARALGNSMLILLLVPWGLDFIFYCFLYFTIEKDRERSRNMGRLLTANMSDLNL